MISLQKKQDEAGKNRSTLTGLNLKGEKKRKEKIEWNIIFRQGIGIFFLVLFNIHFISSLHPIPILGLPFFTRPRLASQLPVVPCHPTTNANLKTLLEQMISALTV